MEKINLKTFDAVIFDLGGVILNIDYNKTVEAFKRIGLENFDDLYSQANQTGLFDELETGKISGNYFINQLLNYLPKGTSANEVVACWNEMLLDFPIENLQFLEVLSQQQRIFLLSNTNEIHVNHFHRDLNKLLPNKTLHDFFEKAYFSNEIGLRKPNVEVFDFVCTSNSLHPTKVLFIDDSVQHINGANELGLQTFHLQSKKLLEEYLEF